MSRRCAVVTGLGAITAAGCGVREVWDALRSGRTGLGPLTLFESPRNGRQLVGQVRVDVDRLAGDARGSRSDKLAWIAAQEAIKQSGLVSPVGGSSADRMGVLLGSTVAGMLGTEKMLDRLLRAQRRCFAPARYHECASATDLCARRLGARGPTATFSTACSAGALAIATAAELIENGEADIILAGGADSLSRLTLNGFGSLLLLDPGGCRPFDAARAGISLGEGAAMLVLEAEETARARGAHILAGLSGWGASCDATHATAPHPQGDGAVAAMQRALALSRLSPPDIDYVSAHGTGTPDNDVMEARALRRVFGDAVPPFASVKRFFGHTLAASGAIKAVVCVQALLEQAVPPNPGFENTDPKIGLQPVREFQPRRLEHVLSNSFGFGGNNVVLVFSRHSEAGAPAYASLVSRVPSIPPTTARLAVVGAGLVSASGYTIADVRSALAAGGVMPSWLELAAPFPLGRMRGYTCGDFGATEAIPTAKRRRLGHLQQMALVAAKRSLPEGFPASVPPERVCAGIGTGLGCLGETAAFVENMLINEERAPLAGRFTNSVHNACASQLAIELNLRGLNSTSTHREISFEAALWHCASELRQGSADFALAGAADELSPYVQATGERWGWWDEHTPAVRPFSRELKGRQRPLPGEGAAVFTLSRPGETSHPLAHLCSVHFGRFATQANGRLEAQTEAAWIRKTLEHDGVSLASVDLLLTGAAGWPRLDDAYREVASALSVLRGHELSCGAYKQASGEHYSASAFGFFVALGLVRGEIEPALCLVGTPSTATSGAPSPDGAALHAGSRRQSCLLLRMRVTRFQMLLMATALLAIAVFCLSAGTARWVTLGALFTACGLAAGLGVSFPEWRMFGPSLCRVHTTQKVVALTFDDGPDPASTPALLDLLARKGARATFFCIGKRVARHRELARRIAAEGHLLGNHSFAHSRGTNLFGDARLRADLERAQAEITQTVGRTPEFFRPPMMLTNQRVFRVTRALSLTVAGCTVRGYDLQGASLQKVLRRVLRRLKPGAIIALHDGGVPPERLVDLVGRLLDQLDAQGYRCLRLDELVACERTYMNMNLEVQGRKAKARDGFARVGCLGCLGLAFILGPFASPLSAEPTNETAVLLDQVARNMGRVESVFARFAQERHLSLFQEPLRSEGYLCFQKPGRIRWEITQPYQSILVSDGKGVAQFERVSDQWKKLELGLGGRNAKRSGANRRRYGRPLRRQATRV